MDITPEMLERSAEALKTTRVVTCHNPEPHDLGEDFNWLTLVQFARIVLVAAMKG